MISRKPAASDPSGEPGSRTADGQHAVKESKGPRPLRHLPLLAAAAGMLLALVFMVGWFAHWTSVIQVLPGLAPMKFNTALGFLLCGLSLALLAKNPRLALVPAALATVVGLLSVMEYATGTSYGLDELFIADYVRDATAFAGRMSPLTAVCFLLLGTALGIATTRRWKNWPLVATGLLASMVVVIAFVALFGYLFGIGAAYGWGAYTRMAVHTAAAFFLLGTALLVRTQQAARTGNINFTHWLPLTGSLTLLAMIAFISALSFAQLKSAATWRQHSYRVLSSVRSLLGDLTDAQRGMRIYLLSGQAAALETYHQGANAQPARLAELFSLTRDNAGQLPRLEILSADLAEVTAYSRRLLDLYGTEGLSAAVRLESSGEGLAVINRARADLQAFSDEEERLETERSNATEADFKNTGRLLVCGSGLAALLLLSANGLASREAIRRKRIEREVLTKDALLEQFIIHSPAAIAMLDTDMRYLQTSERWLKDYRLEGADIIGKSHYEVFPDVPERWKQIHRRVLGGAVERCAGDSFPRADGSLEWLEWEARPWYGAKNKIGGLILFTQVITARKEAEKNLLRLAALVEASEDAIVGKDLHSNITSWNSGAEKVFGYTAAEMIGTSITRLLPPGREDDEIQILAKIRNGESVRQYETLRLTKDGRHIPVAVTVSPVKDAQGIIVALAKVARDITAHKRAEAELKGVHQQLVQTSRQAGMAEVATSVLHNVGNVLNSVNVSATLVADHVRHSKAANLARVCVLLDQHKADLGAFLTTDPKGLIIPSYLGNLAASLATERTTVTAELENLQKNIEHIKDIVGMQQNYAKNSGFAETISLPDLIEDALRINAVSLARHDVQLVRDYQARPVITLDKHKVMQILVNLIRNANDACEESGRTGKLITVRVTADERGIRIAVSDNGVGIPAENLTRIFNHGFTTRKHGHGFGLHSGALAARELGGSLTAASAGVGAGASFTLELPYKTETPTHARPAV